MCDQLDHEKETCEHLFSVIRKTNGRCSYHEEITTGLARVTGKVIVLMWGIGVGIALIMAGVGHNSFVLMKHIDSTKSNVSNVVQVNSNE